MDSDPSLNVLPPDIPITRVGFSLLGCPIGPSAFWCPNEFPRSRSVWRISQISKIPRWRQHYSDHVWLFLKSLSYSGLALQVTSSNPLTCSMTVWGTLCLTLRAAHFRIRHGRKLPYQALVVASTSEVPLYMPLQLSSALWLRRVIWLLASSEVTLSFLLNWIWQFQPVLGTLSTFLLR